MPFSESVRVRVRALAWGAAYGPGVTRKVKWNDGISSGWSCGVSRGYLYSTDSWALGADVPHHTDG